MRLQILEFPVYVIADLAAKYGHAKLLKAVSGWGMGNSEGLLERAAQHGNLSCMIYVKKHLSPKRRELHNALRYAAPGGHTKAVLLIRQWKCENYVGVCRGAIIGGSYKLAKFASEKSPEWSREYPYDAAKGGSVRILKMCKKKNMFMDLNWALQCAAQYGKIRALRLIKKWGANDFDQALLSAVVHNQIEAAALLIKFGGSIDAVEREAHKYAFGHRSLSLISRLKSIVGTMRSQLLPRRTAFSDLPSAFIIE